MSDKSRRVQDWMDDIRKAVEDIRADIGALDKVGFLEDAKTQRAVIKGLMDIGEASNHIMRLAPDIKQRYPDAWQHFTDAYGLRIRLAHAYHRTNPSIVFDTVSIDLPELLEALKFMVVAKGGSGTD